MLIKARLLSTEGEGVDSTISVAHEKLFEIWPALARWIAENQDDLRVLDYNGYNIFNHFSLSELGEPVHFELEEMAGEA